MRVRDHILDSVVFVGVENADGQFVPLGTGFIASVLMAGHVFSHVVTCAHVIDAIAAENVWVRVNLKDGACQTYTVPKDVWVKHPDYDQADGKVRDVAVMLFQPDPQFQLIRLNLDPDGGEVADLQTIREWDIGVGDDIFAIGVFTSHHGETRNLPIVRAGVIAAMPDEPIETNKGFVDGFLAEIRSIGGLSGSPMFFHLAPFRVVEPNTENDKHSEDARLLQSKKTHLLAGMVHGHYELSSPLDAVQEPSDGKKVDQLPAINAGIGIVISLETILETMRHPVLEKKRQAVVDAIRQKKRVVADTAIAVPARPARGENPSHQEDFSSLLDAAAKTPQQDD